MAFDASIFAQSGRPSIALQDPNEVLQRAAQAAAGVNANRLFRAQEQAGQATQQSINPETGLPDQNRLGQAFRALPSSAAIAIPQGLAQGQRFASEQQALSQQRNLAISSILTSTLKAPDNQLRDVAAASLGRAIDMGLAPREQIMGLALGLPSDPQSLRAELNRMSVAIQSPPEQRAAVFGVGAQQQTGDTVQTGVVAPPDVGGGFRPGSVTAMGMSPGEATAPTQIGSTPQGAPIVGTRRQFIDVAGDPGAPSNVGGGALGSGRFPAALRNPANQGPPQGGSMPPSVAPQGQGLAAGGAPQPRPASGGAIPAPAAGAAQSPGQRPIGVVTGLGPGQTAAQATTGTTSANTFQQYAEAGAQAPARHAVLSGMLSDVAQFEPGPLSDPIKRIGAYRQQLGLGGDAGSQSARESFDKLANQLANAQGAGSDARLAVNQGANPSAALSKEGVGFILRQLQGNEDYNIARARLAAAWGDKSDRAGFDARVANLDPRTFQYTRLTAEQRRAYFSNLPAADKAIFKRAYGFAQDRGLLNGR